LWQFSELAALPSREARLVFLASYSRFVDSGPERAERNEIITTWRLIDMLVAEGQELPRQGAHRVDKALGGILPAIHARERRREVQSLGSGPDHVYTSTASPAAASRWH
jgi:hypothetical protein